MKASFLCRRILPAQQDEHLVAGRPLLDDLLAGRVLLDRGDVEDAQDLFVDEVPEQRHPAQDVDLAGQLLGPVLGGRRAPAAPGARPARRPR